MAGTCVNGEGSSGYVLSRLETETQHEVFLYLAKLHTGGCSVLVMSGRQSSATPWKTISSLFASSLAPSIVVFNEVEQTVGQIHVWLNMYYTVHIQPSNLYICTYGKVSAFEFGERI